jgi:hypothetical protein
MKHIDQTLATYAETNKTFETYPETNKTFETYTYNIHL